MGLDLLGISMHISFIFDDDDDDILYVRPIVKRQKHLKIYIFFKMLSTAFI